MVGFNAVKFRKFALLFLSTVEDALAQIDTALAVQDLQTLSAMGHRAKSPALSVGAAGFAARCLLLEQTARSGDAEAAIAIARSLRPQFEDIRSVIERRLAG
jgi:HPt (histidine-containing phosphotransfer) domain-containing protein